VWESNLQFRADDRPLNIGHASAKIRLKNVNHLVIFFAPPPPVDAFVANKRQTAIRPDGDRTVESLFSRSFGLESRSIFLAVPIADFTLWLIDKTLLIAALRRLNLLVFKDKYFRRLGS
jgi:hypothetical protein